MEKKTIIMTGGISETGNGIEKEIKSELKRKIRKKLKELKEPFFYKALRNYLKTGKQEDSWPRFLNNWHGQYVITSPEKIPVRLVKTASKDCWGDYTYTTSFKIRIKAPTFNSGYEVQDIDIVLLNKEYKPRKDIHHKKKVSYGRYQREL